MADIDDQVRRVVNDYRRQEISEKYNAVFSEPNLDLSPIVESEWPDSIEEFERQFETAAEIPLRTSITITPDKTKSPWSAPS